MKKVVVIDLDKTFLKVNTFKLYIYYVSIWALQVVRLDICFILTFYTLLRKCRFISHSDMKFHILKKTEFFMNKQRLNFFVNLISKEVNVNVLHLLHMYKAKGYYCCLSTAAPTNYAVIIQRRYDFNGLCATPMPSDVNEWHENVREEKCRNTLKHILAEKLIFEVLITDHHDDIALLKIRKSSNILVNPSLQTVQKMLVNNIQYEQLLG